MIAYQCDNRISHSGVIVKKNMFYQDKLLPYRSGIGRNKKSPELFEAPEQIIISRVIRQFFVSLPFRQMPREYNRVPYGDHAVVVHVGGEYADIFGVS